MHRYIAVGLLLMVLSISGQAGSTSTAPKASSKSGELFNTIARMDSTIFEAFNGHDVDRLMSFFTADVEFYHDTGGLTDFQQTKSGFSNMFSGSPDIRRDLVKGSLEVYPIKDYGALEIGEHSFCHKENGKDDCGSFRFVMIWRKDGESWKLSRVISYGH